ncbi:MAG: family 16 glycosylhydrolase [Armatimonadota bacterium]|nr:family 16 glycosylhydrolase [Armatimonadota bacterium]
MFLLHPLGAWAQKQATPSTANHIPTLPGWTPTFDEEFNGTRLDPKKWTAADAPPNLQELPLQYYRPDESTVAHGVLTIHTEQTTYRGYDFVSGDISSLNKFAQCYGRYEVRCRFPRTAGTWSAAYLLPASGAWPPEIDVCEFIGNDPQTVYLTNHWPDGFGGRQMHSFHYHDMAADWSQWHVYAIEWEPGIVRWYVDGVQRISSTQHVADVPMYLRLNTAVGGHFAGRPDTFGWPQVFQIDYVRVWRRPLGPEPVLGVTAAPPVVPPAPSNSSAAPPLPETPTATWGPSDTLGVFLLLLLGAMAVRSERQQPTTTALLAVAVALSALYYLFWRVGVINWAAWGIALPLFGAELFGIVQVLGFHYTIWPRPQPRLQAHEDPTRRAIFVLIPTVNEGVDILTPTIQGALTARARYLEEYPHGQVTIAVCNDGQVAGYAQWAEVERLAETLGVSCLTRTVSGGAKAGNLEHARHALGATVDALVVIFDADMAAEPDFLLQTIPPFADWSVGWVQTGQYYRNLENPVARWAHDQQRVFFQTLCPGKAALNACFICGTNVVIRAEALDEIGGLPQDSITEDFAASVLLHGRWRSVYLPDVLATGLGPLDLPSYFTQQGRWAVGTFGVLRRHGTRLLRGGGGLTWPQRLQYLLSGTHYAVGLTSVIFLLAPLLYLLGGVSALRGADLPAFLRHFLPFWLLSQLAFWYASGRTLHWRGTVLGFGSSPTLLGSLAAVLLGRRVGFAVTGKTRRPQSSPVRALLPHACAALVCLAALGAALGGSGPLVILSVLWVLYTLLMLGALLRLGAADWLAAQREAEDTFPAPTGPNAIQIIADAKRERRQ